MELFVVFGAAFMICACVAYLSVPVEVKLSQEQKAIAKQNSGFAVRHGMVWREGFKGIVGDKKLVRSSFKSY